MHNFNVRVPERGSLGTRLYQSTSGLKSTREWATRGRACDYVKFETRQNLLPELKIVTHTVLPELKIVTHTAHLCLFMSLLDRASGTGLPVIQAVRVCPIAFISLTYIRSHLTAPLDLLMYLN